MTSEIVYYVLLSVLFSAHASVHMPVCTCLGAHICVHMPLYTCLCAHASVHMFVCTCLCRVVIGLQNTNMPYVTTRLNVMVLHMMLLSTSVLSLSGTSRICSMHFVFAAPLMPRDCSWTCVWASVNQGGTNHNRCTQRLVTLAYTDLLMNPDHTQKLSDLLYGSQSPADKKWASIAM